MSGVRRQHQPRRNTMHVNEIIAQNVAATSVRDALHAKPVADPLDCLRGDGRLGMSAVEVVDLGDANTVIHLGGDAEGGLAIIVGTRDGENEMTLHCSADLGNCTPKWGFSLEQAIEMHIAAALDAEASSISS